MRKDRPVSGMSAGRARRGEGSGAPALRPGTVALGAVLALGMGPGAAIGGEGGRPFDQARFQEAGRAIWQGIPPAVYAQLSRDSSADGGDIPLDTITVEGREGPSGGAADSRGYEPRGDLNVTSLDVPPRQLPAVVNVIPQEFVRDRAADRLRDIVDYTPGVTVREANGGTGDLFVIRGFESKNVAVNGLRRREFTNLSTSLANVDRVEVLKGPAGLEAGVVEPGGLINFVTKKPQAVAAHTLSLDAGTYERFGAVMDSTGPVNGNPDLLYRLVSEMRSDDSFRDNAFSKRFLLAPSFKWNYAEGSSALLELEYRYLDQPYDRGTFYLEGAGFRNGFAPIRRSFHEPTDSQKSHQGRAALYVDHKLSDVFSLRASAEYLIEDYRSLGARNPTLNGLYVPGTNRYSGNPVVTRSFSDFNGTIEQFLSKAEGVARFETGPLKHQIVAGLGWSAVDYNIGGQDGQTRWPINAFTPVYGTLPVVLGRAQDGVGRDYDLEAAANYRSAFAQYKLDAWERLHIVGGVRYDKARFKETYVNNIFTDGPAPADRFGGEGVTSFRIGAAYDLTDAVTVFAGYSNAFEPQPGKDRRGETFAPLEAVNVEAGVKVAMFGGRALLTASTFQITQSNLAEPDPDNLPGQSFRILVGEVRVRGAEVQLAGRVTDDLQLIAGASFLDAEITRSTSGQRGNRPYGVPRFQGSVWAKYGLGGLGLPGFSVAAGVVHVGEREGDNANSFRLPSYARVDAALFYDWSNLQFRLAAENLFDEVYYLGSQNRAQNIVPGAPLRVTAGLTARF